MFNQTKDAARAIYLRLPNFLRRPVNIAATKIRNLTNVDFSPKRKLSIFIMLISARAGSIIRLFARQQEMHIIYRAFFIHMKMYLHMTHVWLAFPSMIVKTNSLKRMISKLD